MTNYNSFKIKQIQNEVVDRFEGDYEFLSNFSPHGFMAECGNYFPTVEHYFQFNKADFSNKDNYPILEKMMSSRDPALAKKLGKTLNMRIDWLTHRHVVMYVGNNYKYDTHRDIREKLISLENFLIIEGNSWGDIYWGVCNGKGENHLGTILMTLRDMYISKKYMSIDI